MILPKTCRLVYLFNIEIKLHRIVIEKEEEMGIKLTSPMSASLHPGVSCSQAQGVGHWTGSQSAEISVKRKTISFNMHVIPFI